VDRSRQPPQPEVDALLGIVIGGFKQLIFEVLLPTEIALGQRRPVVGEVGLGADEVDLTVEAVLAQARRRRGPSQGGTNDHDAPSANAPRVRSCSRYNPSRTILVSPPGRRRWTRSARKSLRERCRLSVCEERDSGRHGDIPLGM